ncbi:DegT/DnrJ/EryC1/StrS family aminotransferase [Verrucomicrobiales bacterium]|nr:DegT/DnrJ/EryC1/StrS family aminotransferase [Verrucomicrobiales bacterium]
MNIPFFRYPHVFNQQKEDILQSMLGVIERGAFILQEELDQFEKKAAEFVDAKHAIGVANGTDSLIIACRAANIQKGDEVIMASHTYIATAAAVHFANAKPVLVDCGEDRLLDPNKVESAITKNTKAIMPTQLNGRTCNMEALDIIAKKYNLSIIEDAAQALGAKYKGKCAGTFGIAGSISLYPAKLLGCFGDGGLLFTNDDDMAKKIRLLRDHGRNEDGQVVTWGLNSRLDTLNAAICLTKLKIHPQEIARRREIARLYQHELENIGDLTLPPGPDDDPDRFDCYQNYEIESGHREKLRNYLNENGIGTIIQWAGTPVHQFSGLHLPNYSLPITEAFFEKCFLLPMNTSLENAEIEYICSIIKKFYASH